MKTAKLKPAKKRHGDALVAQGWVSRPYEIKLEHTWRCCRTSASGSSWPRRKQSEGRE